MQTPSNEHGIQPLVVPAGPWHPEALVPGDLQLDFLGALRCESGQNSRGFPVDLLPFRPAHGRKTHFRWQLRTGLQARLPGGFSINQRVLIDSDPTLDPLSRTKEYRQIDAAISVPLAEIRYQWRGLDLWLGRNWEVWGPGWTGSLSLDNGFPAADGFGLSWTSRKWAGSFRVGRIDDHLTAETSTARYLAAHRLDILLAKNLRLGLSETVLVSTPRSMPLWLLNPLLPWALTQGEQRAPEESSNILWAFDTTWNISQSWTVYGQFLLDDVMVDLEDRDKYPDQLGWLLGGLYTPGHSADNTATKLTLGLEYSRLHSWTYVHRNPAVRYRIWNGTSGHPAGPDSETATAFISQATPNGFGDWALAVRWHRQGQVWLDTPLNPVGQTDLSWPTQPVNQWWQLGLSTRLALPLDGSLEIRGGWNGTKITPAAGPPAASPPEHADAADSWWASLQIEIPLLILLTQL